jgi:N-acetylglucosamine-6-phosphate deacetylase
MRLAPAGSEVLRCRRKHGVSSPSHAGASLDALVNGEILLDGGRVADRAVLLAEGRIQGVVDGAKVPDDARRIDLEGGLLAPGFIDLQVNGGGGVLFNDAPELATIARIGAAHRRHGTTGFLPTLITTDRATMAHAIAAVQGAIEAGVPGVLGIHLEGPHINPARKGVHDEAQIRPLGPDDLALLTSLQHGHTLVTLAPECVPRAAIETLARDAIVFAGHTDGTFEQIRAGLAAGISGFTHLFNAMSQLGSREPGAVGAALTSDAACGIIVDDHHVHRASLRLAFEARPGGLFLVTDAMPPAGADQTGFALGGQWIEVREGRCTTADGRLAGSALDMAAAVRNAVQLVAIPLDEALRMASLRPAEVLGDAERGRIAPGMWADLVLLDQALQVRATWIAGDVVWSEATP